MLAIVFDLDGLLADTETLHCKAYVAALQEVGVALAEEEYAEHWIRRGLGIVELCEQRKLTVDPYAVRARKAVHYDALVRSSVQPMPGAAAFLDLVRPHYPLAIGTSCFRQSADLVLACLGFEFSVVATVRDGIRPKPAPDIFLDAAAGLGVSPRDCLVLEDAEKGVVAARAAGMRCIAVPNAHTRDHDFSGALRVLSSLEQLTLSDLAQLAAH